MVHERDAAVAAASIQKDCRILSVGDFNRLFVKKNLASVDWFSDNSSMTAQESALLGAQSEHVEGIGARLSAQEVLLAALKAMLDANVPLLPGHGALLSALGLKLDASLSQLQTLGSKLDSSIAQLQTLGVKLDTLGGKLDTNAAKLDALLAALPFRGANSTLITTVTVGVSSIQLVGANPARRGLYLWNAGGNQVAINLGATANWNAPNLRIAATDGLSVVGSPVWQGALSAIRNSGSGAVIVTELL